MAAKFQLPGLLWTTAVSYTHLRGNTGIPVRGMYSGEQGEMLMAVVRPRELPLLKQAVHDIDPNAFVTVCSAQEVLGEGFVERSDAVPAKRRKQRKTKPVSYTHLDVYKRQE